MRLNEKELNLVECSLKGFKKDSEDTIDRLVNRPPLTDSRFLDERGEHSVYVKAHKEVLEQINNLLKRIEDVR